MNLPAAKQVILAEISQSRTAVARDLRALRDELNLTEKIRDSVRTHSPLWMGGAATASFLFTRIFRGKKEASAPRKKGDSPRETTAKRLGSLTLGGVSIALVRLLFPLVKSAIFAYATKKIYKASGWPR